MPDQPSKRDQAPRPPRKGKPQPPRPRDGEAARPPRQQNAAPRPKQQGSAGNASRPQSRPWLGNATPRKRIKSHLANEGAFYNTYHPDPQWPALEEGAQRALVLMSKHLLQSLAAAGWQVVANRRNDAPEYTFGFDNIWTLRAPDGSRTLDFSPEQSYRELLYVIAPYGDAPAEPELDRRAITSPTMLEQKAIIIARHRVDELTAL